MAPVLLASIAEAQVRINTLKQNKCHALFFSPIIQSRANQIMCTSARVVLHVCVCVCVCEFNSTYKWLLGHGQMSGYAAERNESISRVYI